MNFFKIIILIIFATYSLVAIADNHDLSQSATDQTVGSSEMLDDEEVPLNDPFAGNEGQNINSNIPEEEQEDEMSLYNFKLAGLISGKNYSYISLVNSGGEVMTITIGQFLGKIKFVDLRLTEAIFQKEDETYLILDFNNQIREANEY
ncbi:MAG: pilus assembly protein PilP [Candidatus Pelagibacter sp.]